MKLWLLSSVIGTEPLWVIVGSLSVHRSMRTALSMTRQLSTSIYSRHCVAFQKDLNVTLSSCREYVLISLLLSHCISESMSHCVWLSHCLSDCMSHRVSDCMSHCVSDCMSYYVSDCLTVSLMVCLTVSVFLTMSLIVSLCVCDCMSHRVSVCLTVCLIVSLCVCDCMSHCVSDCLTVSLFVSLCVWLSHCVPDCLTVSLFVSLCVWLSLCVSVCLIVSLFVSLYVWLSHCVSAIVCLTVCLWLYVSLCVWLFHCVSDCLSVCLFVSLCVWLSLCVSVCLIVSVICLSNMFYSRIHWALCYLFLSSCCMMSGASGWVSVFDCNCRLSVTSCWTTAACHPRLRTLARTRPSDLCPRSYLTSLAPRSSRCLNWGMTKRYGCRLASHGDHLTVSIRCCQCWFCMECRRGLAMRILSVRLSVCPSVCLSVCPWHAWIVTKR